MAVRLRMKKMGRKHQPFFRLVAVDQRAARDGKVIEYLGHYDPMVKETDARVKLNAERIDYWLSVGAQPSDKVGVLIKKYGTDGTHLEQQRQAVDRLQTSKPTAPPAVVIPKPKAEVPAAEETASEEAASGEAPSEEAAGAAAASAAEEPAAEVSAEAPAEAASEEAAPEEKTE